MLTVVEDGDNLPLISCWAEDIKEMMKRYIYTVWFRDNRLDAGDQDHEYPACIAIEAENENTAKAWCDELSQDFSKRHQTMEILNSKIEGINSYKGSKMDLTPFIKCGYKASDDEIGW